MIEFGRNKNQIDHRFRHTDAAGLLRGDVEAAVLSLLLTVESSLRDGAYTGDVRVKGVQLEFRAYTFSNGDIHVGRITVR